MLNRWPVLAAAALLCYAAYTWAQQQSDLADLASGAADTLDAIGTDLMNTIVGYSPDRVPEQYRAAIAQAESANGLPDGLLARQLWQESRYKPSVISGEKRSAVGAIGIAQFMPATARDLGIDPTDPFQSIAAAGRYMGSLYRQTGDWAQALAAYNWGIGNVKRKGLDAAPLETRNYYTQILGDVATV